jgi:heat shock protein HslJ
MLVRIVTMLGAALTAAGAASAAVPPFTAECRPDLNVQADARGAVRVNGKSARLIPRPDGQTTALAGGVHIDITPRGSEPPRVTYTARDKSVDTCAVVSFREPDGAVAPQRPLADTRWRLIEFQSMDDRQGTTRPHDPAAYTMHLRADGRVLMQLNCNRAQGAWSATPAAVGSSGRFEFGPLAMTRALCPPPSMDEMIAAQAAFVRGYQLKDGNLYLSLMADGGIFAWQPDPAVATAAPLRPAGPAEGGPRDWQLAGTGSPAALRETASTSARVVARLARGTLLDNLGCKAGAQADDRVWCDVQPLGGGPRGYLPADTLAPAVAPDGTVPTGEDDSALRAGQGRFDATGKLPCAQRAGLALSPCDFGAARAGGGYATVVVTRPEGRTRAIYFRLGRALGADTSQADGMPPFATVRDGETYRIRVGAERYEIPRSVVLGP